MQSTSTISAEHVETIALVGKVVDNEDLRDEEIEAEGHPPGEPGLLGRGERVEQATVEVT